MFVIHSRVGTASSVVGGEKSHSNGPVLWNQDYSFPPVNLLPQGQRETVSHSGLHKRQMVLLLAREFICLILKINILLMSINAFIY